MTILISRVIVLMRDKNGKKKEVSFIPKLKQFLPRDAMHTRGLCICRLCGCPCVCHVRELRQNE